MDRVNVGSWERNFEDSDPEWITIKMADFLKRSLLMYRDAMGKRLICDAEVIYTIHRVDLCGVIFFMSDLWRHLRVMIITCWYFFPDDLSRFNHRLDIIRKREENREFFLGIFMLRVWSGICWGLLLLILWSVYYFQIIFKKN